jgi:putative dimethyl sulfoxide reductase chaperone
MARDTSGAGAASGRAAFYGLLTTVFELLPDQLILAKIRAGEFQRVLMKYRELARQGFGPGLDLIDSYQSSIKDRPDETVLAELAIDRTRIMRGTGHPDMKPPYEGLYSTGSSFGDSLLGVKRFYRKAGLVPDETVSDSADYLCVELDFMKQLCLREEAVHLDKAEPGKTIIETVAEIIALEEEFLRVHLGSWVGLFCSAVGKHASTDFYRGFALILDAYVRMDREWLQSLLGT